MQKLGVEYARYVHALGRRASVAWGVKRVVYVDRLPADPAAFAALRRANRVDPLLPDPVPRSFVGALEIRLTAPLPDEVADFAAHPEKFHLFLGDGVGDGQSTLMCSLTYLTNKTHRRALAEVVEEALRCRATLGLTTLAVEKSRVLSPLALPGIAAALRAAADTGPSAVAVAVAEAVAVAAAAAAAAAVVTDPSDAKPTTAPTRRAAPGCHLVLCAGTAETKTSVTLSESGAVQVHVRLGSLATSSATRRILAEYTAYRD